MQAHPLGKDAAIIGKVVAGHPGMVLMKTQIGGTGVLDVIFGEQLPPHVLSAQKSFLAKTELLGTAPLCRLLLE